SRRDRGLAMGRLLPQSCLEGNVIDVDEGLLAGSGPGGRSLRLRRGSAGLHRHIGHPATAKALAGLTAFEPDHAVGADLDAGALLSVLALPLPGAQPAFGVDLVSLAQ